MNYKDKQEWIEAVMASDLGAATKVYAWGVFKHMYGTKDDSFPSGKAIAKVTGLSTGKFYLHNKALEDAGYLEVTHRRGRSNEYRITEPTHRRGRSETPEVTDLPTEEVTTYPQKVEGLPTEGVTPTHRRGTNTIRKTISKTSSEEIKLRTTAKAAVQPEELQSKEELPPSSGTKEDDPEIIWDIETTKDLPPSSGREHQDAAEGNDAMDYKIYMGKGQQDTFESAFRGTGATKDQISEAAQLLKTSSVQGYDYYEKCVNALGKVGVEIDAW